ncbi:MULTISPECIES: hypothetical protein [Pseudomonas]|uniref:hypothetical protein n=1 Tax=Pseudomonas TaxID=286 RepID=UPI001E4C7FD8|nr:MULTISPECIES: hypothetical protein [Pseudomonas]MCE1116564.1 hypothetical protein [Pseudomonas sp. NMI795_08]
MLMADPLVVGLSVASCRRSRYFGRTSAPNKVSLQINISRPQSLLLAAVHGVPRAAARGERKVKAMAKFTAIVFLIILKFDKSQVERAR